MKKKLAILITTTATLGLTVGTLVFATQVTNTEMAKSVVDYHMVLNDKSKVYEKEEDILHQINYKNNIIDLVGWSSVGGLLGSIKSNNYGDLNYNYRGMIYNRSLINGLSSLKVSFSGGHLYYQFTSFLMEDMEFYTGTNELTSGVSVSVNPDKGYFVIYTGGGDRVNIDSIDVGYSCQEELTATQIFDKNNNMGGARSLAKRTTFNDGYVEIENNPLKTTNNYSVGSDSKHQYTWYRWNGRYFDKSADLGTKFSFGMTVIGEYSRMVDPNKYFHYAVWPQFDYGNPDDRPWVQTYIGNDNYEPLGRDNALHPEDAFTYDSYTGRFFGSYDYPDTYHVRNVTTGKDVVDPNNVAYHFYTQAEAQAFIDNKLSSLYPDDEFITRKTKDYIFADPDNTDIAGGGMTLRQAYDKYQLPFWYIRFDIHLNIDNDPECAIWINNMLVYRDTIFYEYDTVNTPDINIWTMPLHVVNYGINAEGDPDESYTGTFTYPRLIN